VRTTIRSLVVAILTLFGSVLVGLASTITSAVTLAATALIVPGTGDPDPGAIGHYEANAIAYYISPTTASCATTCNPVGIPYDAQFAPLGLIFPGWGGLNGATWNVSVQSGVTSLNSAVVDQLSTDPTGDIAIFGYSQGAAVASIEKTNLADVTNKSQFAFVLIGNIERPNGGLWERLAALGTVPILNVTTGLPTPTDTGIQTTDIAFQYDGVADFPEYPINILGDLNAIGGFEYIHGDYLNPTTKNPGALPYGYTPATLAAAIANPANQQVVGDTTYITIPATSLPILYPFENLAAATGTLVLVAPIVNLIQPALQVLIETGYNRTNYGQPTPFELIPPINPITLTTQLIAAGQEGVNNAVSNLGTMTIVPLPPFPDSPSTPASTTPVTAPEVSATSTTTTVKALNTSTPTNTLGATNSASSKPVTLSGVGSDLHQLTTALTTPPTKTPTTAGTRSGTSSKARAH
jgi:PE-PPE domain